MGDILVNISVAAQVAQAPTQTGAPVTNIDFQISPAEMLAIPDYNEDASGRFQLAASVVDEALSMGTVVLGKLLFIKVDTDCQLKVTNGLGDSQLLTLKANKTSIMHMEFTGIKLTNPGTTVIRGKYCVVGD